MLHRELKSACTVSLLLSHSPPEVGFGSVELNKRVQISWSEYLMIVIDILELIECHHLTKLKTECTATQCFKAK